MVNKNDKTYWAKKWTKKTDAPNSFARRALTLIRKKKLQTLLDLGSGDGRDSLYFANKGLTVYSLDFSKSGITMLKKKNPAIKAFLGDIKKLPFKKNSFDVIYAHLSLHYFTDSETKKIFARLHGILKKDGLLFVKRKSIHDPLFGRGKKIKENMYRSGHTRHFFSIDYMQAQLKKFKVIKIAKTSSIYAGFKSAFIEATAIKV